VSRALAKVPGIGTIDIKEGAPDFTVHFDSKLVKPDAIVKALIAGGEKGAKLKS
jgi:hypothetical protein